MDKGRIKAAEQEAEGEEGHGETVNQEAKLLPSTEAETVLKKRTCVLFAPGGVPRDGETKYWISDTPCVGGG